MIRKFAENIRELRNKKNLSKRAMALEIGVTPSTYASYENDEKIPTLETAKTIADVFNVSLDWLCGRAQSNEQADNHVPKSLGDVVRACAVLLDASNNASISAKERWFDKIWAGALGKGEEVEISPPKDELDCSTAYTRYDLTINLKECDVGRIGDAWQKLLDLYRHGDVERDMYTAWVEKKVEEYSKTPISKE